MVASLSLHDLTLTVDHSFQAMVIGVLILIKVFRDTRHRLT